MAGARGSPASCARCATTASPSARRDARCAARSSPRRRRCGPRSLQPALRALFCATRSDWRAVRRDLRRLLAGPRHAARCSSDRGAPTGRAAPRRCRADGRAGGRRRSPDRVERGRRPGRRPQRRRREPARAGAPRAETAGARPTSATSSIPTRSREAHALAERLAQRMRARLVRREQARRRGRRLDLRRTIHRSISHGGTPIELVWRRRKAKPLRLVVLLDASGSMSLYTAFFVRFLHGVVDAFREAEAFVFHTRLVHVSASVARARRRARGRPAVADGAGHRRRHAHRRVPGDLQPLARQARASTRAPP